MKRTIARTLLAGSLLLVAGGAVAAPNPCQSLDPHRKAGADAVAALSVYTGPSGFTVYRDAVAKSARGAGAGDLAKGVEASDPALASCLLRFYTTARYGARMVKDLQDMVGFRTYAEEGKENWSAPEFLRQRRWLEQKARDLGLTFKSYDGRVDEITLPGPAPVLAVLTHGDVQDVKNQHWSSPPWEGRLVENRIVGRGTEDDKGPIVATLYAMAALRDTGWPLGMTIRLLVANAEESSWEEIPYYLERAAMPEMTLGIDAAYPVVNAQKGYGVVTFRGQGAADPKGVWRVVKMSGGSGMSIIPESGEAVLDPEGDAGEALAEMTELTRRAADWATSHPPARLSVTREGDLLKVTAEGKGGHSSEPTSGHNALGDLTAFLSTLDLRKDAWGSLAAFVGSAVGTETDGKSLGIAHRDEVMGELTSNLSFLRDDKGTPVAEINIRVPRGISREEIAKRIAARANGAAVGTDVALLSEPHIAPAEGKLVSTLLSVWEEVTGQPGRPIAIGGGTQARLFKGGVDFGPASGMERYRGHGPDEYLTVEELHRITELTVAALWRLASRGD
ncbi:MAG TPA: Sapep family Mn(2+)-dependent dipeptidase [Thermoanaerobaculia bacterium]